VLLRLLVLIVFLGKSNIVLFLSSNTLEDKLMSNILDPVDPTCFNHRVDGQFP
jgi:hypothetical protein